MFSLNAPDNYTGLLVGNFLANPVLNITKTFTKWADLEATGNAVGDVAVFRVTVKNDGNVTLTNVVINDPLTGVPTDVGTLAPGASAGYDLSYAITQNDLNSKGDTADVIAGLTADADTKVDNKASATSDQDNSDTVFAEAPLLYNPVLNITKTFTKWADLEATGNAVGDVAVFRVTVKNDGNVTLTNVVINDPLTGVPTNVGTLAPGASAGYDLSYAITQNNLNSKGDTADVIAGLTADADTKVDNKASATSDQDNSDTVFAQAPLLYNPVLNITKTFTKWADLEATGNAVGDVAVFRVTVKNDGNVTLTNVVINDPLTGVPTNVGTLAPGASAGYDLSYAITQNDLNSKGDTADVIAGLTADADTKVDNGECDERPGQLGHGLRPGSVALQSADHHRQERQDRHDFGALCPGRLSQWSTGEPQQHCLLRGGAQEHREYHPYQHHFDRRHHPHPGRYPEPQLYGGQRSGRC